MQKCEQLGIVPSTFIEDGRVIGGRVEALSGTDGVVLEAFITPEFKIKDRAEKTNIFLGVGRSSHTEEYKKFDLDKHYWFVLAGPPNSGGILCYKEIEYFSENKEIKEMIIKSNTIYSDDWYESSGFNYGLLCGAGAVLLMAVMLYGFINWSGR